MIFLSLDEFLERGIPALIAGKPRLKVLLASYNHIGNYRTGPVTTLDPRLSVMLYRGCLGRTGIRDASAGTAGFRRDGIMVVHSLRDAVCMDVDADKLMNQLAVGAALRNEYIEESENVLLVVYAGRNPRFTRSVTDAVHFKLANPSAAVVVVTCDCDEEDKKRSVLTGLIDLGELTHAVITRECGGVGSMQAVAEGIIGRWRATH